jgi:hypothetical protein
MEGRLLPQFYNKDAKPTDIGNGRYYLGRELGLLMERNKNFLF